MAEEIGAREEHVAQIGATEIVEIETGGLDLVVETDAVVRLTGIDEGESGIVEEEAVAEMREDERDADVAARAVIDMAVP